MYVCAFVMHSARASIELRQPVHQIRALIRGALTEANTERHFTITEMSDMYWNNYSPGDNKQML